MGSWPQTPVGTFSDFNLEPFEKLRCCGEEPRGFPLTLTKDIMVNGKVLHLESSPPARIFKLGAPPPPLQSHWTLCAVCLVCES